MTHFEWGFVGALSANVFRLGSFIGQPKQIRAAILKDPFYVIQFFVLPFIGGFIATSYGEPACVMPGILPFHIGASAPALMRLMTGSVPHGKQSSD